MKLRHPLMVGVMALICLLTMRVESVAAGIGLSAAASTNQIVAGNQITYTVNVTNLTGLTVVSTYVTNLFSGSATLISATNSLGTSPFANPITTVGGAVLFRLDDLTNNASAVLTAVVTPSGAGGFTNTVTGYALTTFGTNATSQPTNVVVQVYSGRSDLAVGVALPAASVLVNDLAEVQLTVANAGPNAASGVVLSNTIPSGLVPVGISPASLSGLLTNGNLVVNFGSIASGSSTQIFLFIQPTNSGSFPITASVSATTVLDTNLLNNVVTNTISVGTNLVSSLVVTNIATQYFNGQTALMNQWLRVENFGTNDAPAFRLFVSGLNGSNRLSVAVGTNSGQPFVLHNATVATNQGVDLLMEYFSPTRTNIPGLGFTAVAVPRVDLSPATNLATVSSDTVFVLTGKRLGSGAFMLEFPSLTNRAYTVVYSDDASFSNAVMSQPSVVSSANKKQWIDSGPPRTLSHPTNTPARFYRVFRAQ